MNRLQGHDGPSVRFRPVVTLCLLGLAFTWVSEKAQAQPQNDPQSTARRWLAQNDLVEHDKRWILREETQLLERLKAIEQLEERAIATRTVVEGLVARNRAVLAKLNQLRQLEPQLPEKGPQRARAAAQITALEKEYLAPKAFAESPPIRSAVIKMLNTQNRPALLALQAPLQIAELTKKYQALEKSTQWKQVLGSIDSESQLGSGTDYVPLLARLKELKMAVQPQSPPIYRQQGQYRTTAILEDRHVLTVTLRQDDIPSWLPASVLQAAEIEIPANAPYITLFLPDGRKLNTRLITLGQLRLGSYQFTGDRVLVLPPEGEDLGAQIGLKGLAGYRLEFHPERLFVTPRHHGTEAP